jgi:hypothetical protein
MRPLGLWFVLMKAVPFYQKKKKEKVIEFNPIRAGMRNCEIELEDGMPCAILELTVHH